MDSTISSRDTLSSIEYGEKAKAFELWSSSCLPVGMTCVGLASLSSGETGALFKSSSGFYYYGSEGRLRLLPTEEVMLRFR
jgi:hypothetical protein